VGGQGLIPAQQRQPRALGPLDHLAADPAGDIGVHPPVVREQPKGVDTTADELHRPVTVPPSPRVKGLPSALRATGVGCVAIEDSHPSWGWLCHRANSPVGTAPLAGGRSGGAVRRPPVPATRTVRRDGPAVGKKLAGVVKDDHPVAQQHPSLLGMAGHHPGRVMGGVASAGTCRLVATRPAPAKHRLVEHRGFPGISQTAVDRAGPHLRLRLNAGRWPTGSRAQRRWVVVS